MQPFVLIGLGSLGFRFRAAMQPVLEHGLPLTPRV